MSEAHHLQLVTDPLASSRGLIPALRDAMAEGVNSVQVRDRSATPRSLLETVMAVSRVARTAEVRILVNDRVDVALAIRAHGVHLGVAGLPAEVVRALLEPWQLVGVSVHSLEQAVAASRAGADYLAFGHVFATPSHPGEEPRGTQALAEIVDAVDVPVLAIGGITAGRVAEVLATRCAGISVISAILGADDPARATSELRRALDGVSVDPKRAFPERRD